MLLTTVAVPLGLAGQEPPQAPRHLEQAGVMLDRIPEKPSGEDADKRIADLRRHFTAMVKAYAERPEGAPPSAVITVRSEPDRDADDDPAAARDWTLQFSNVERDLAKIIGGGTYSGAATQPLVAAAGSVVPAPVGTVGTVPANAPRGVPNVVPAEAAAVGAQGVAGGQAVVGDLGTVGAIAATKVSEVGIRDLDLNVRRQLEQFRIELELFYTFSLSETMRSQGVTKPASAPLQDR
jgi:hypothetical protein